MDFNASSKVSFRMTDVHVSINRLESSQPEVFWTLTLARSFPSDLNCVMVLTQDFLIFCLQLEFQVCGSEENLNIESQTQILFATAIPVSILQLGVHSLILQT